jgi:hypothetical protein
VKESPGLDLGKDKPSDATTIARFRHLIKKPGLAPSVVALVNWHLQTHESKIDRQTIVAATVLHRPTATENERQRRDANRGSATKGGQWQLGAKPRVGLDKDMKMHYSFDTALGVQNGIELALGETLSGCQAGRRNHDTLAPLEDRLNAVQGPCFALRKRALTCARCSVNSAVSDGDPHSAPVRSIQDAPRGGQTLALAAGAEIALGRRP